MPRCVAVGCGKGAKRRCRLDRRIVYCGSDCAKEDVLHRRRRLAEHMVDLTTVIATPTVTTTAASAVASGGGGGVEGGAGMDCDFSNPAHFVELR
jgi:hypothetical protein